MAPVTRAVGQPALHRQNVCATNWRYSSALLKRRSRTRDGTQLLTLPSRSSRRSSRVGGALVPNLARAASRRAMVKSSGSGRALRLATQAMVSLSLDTGLNESQKRKAASARTAPMAQRKLRSACSEKRTSRKASPVSAWTSTSMARASEDASRLGRMKGPNIPRVLTPGREFQFRSTLGRTLAILSVGVGGGREAGWGLGLVWGRRVGDE